jgi:flagellar biosynthesis protein FlhA
MLNVDLIELEVGYGLIPFVDAAQDGELLSRIQSIRKQFALSSGFIVPPVHIKDNLQLNPNQYTISLKGVVIATAEMMPGHFMAMDPGLVTETIKGVATREPAFDLPAIWITDDKREQAQIAGYTVVDCITVMATHISEVIKQHAHELLGRQETQTPARQSRQELSEAGRGTGTPCAQPGRSHAVSCKTCCARASPSAICAPSWRPWPITPP